MLAILSDTFMTATRMDGFRYDVDAEQNPRRPSWPRSRDTQPRWQAKQTAEDDGAGADQPL